MNWELKIFNKRRAGYQNKNDSYKKVTISYKITLFSKYVIFYIEKGKIR